MVYPNIVKGLIEMIMIDFISYYGKGRHRCSIRSDCSHFFTCPVLLCIVLYYCVFIKGDP